MACERVPIPGGGHAIVCGRSRSKPCGCGQPADRLCDWKVPGKRSGTCDKPVCSSCATSPAPNKDLCPGHAQAYEQWKANRNA